MPDQRFGQLIYNIATTYSEFRDNYQVEDDKWLEWINQFREEYGRDDAIKPETTNDPNSRWR